MSIVKKLVWDDAQAESIIGTYDFGRIGGIWTLRLNGDDIETGVSTNFRTASGDAKYAAQADHERRILSALTTDPRAMVAAALERAAAVADNQPVANNISFRIRAIIDTDHAAALEALVQERAGALVAADHPDDEAVNRFSAAMKQKLKWEREVRGRSGWDDPDACSTEYLAQLFVEHLTKGNAGTFEDVANFAMMLHQRGANPSELAEANRRQLSESEAREYQRGQEDEREAIIASVIKDAEEGDISSGAAQWVIDAIRARGGDSDG